MCEGFRRAPHVEKSQTRQAHRIERKAKESAARITSDVRFQASLSAWLFRTFDSRLVVVWRSSRVVACCRATHGLPAYGPRCTEGVLAGTHAALRVGWIVL